MKRTVDADLENLRRSPMVSWFHPVELLRTGFRLVFGRQIAAYFDRRELQAALQAIPLPGEQDSASPPLVDADLSDRDEVWIDFISDVGDGWDPVYTMASLLGRASLAVEGLDQPLPRADVLVVGGDQVYPAPSREGYRVRFRGPYAAALPEVKKGEREPLMLAIPGDHDWYDGLTHFLRNFCQGGRTGAWRLVQRRSYFSAKLPHGWWLWGLDIPLETRIDAPQLGHFDRLSDAVDAARDRIILCAHAPSWLYGGSHDRAYRNLEYFEDRVIHRRGKRVGVTLAGRVHAYHRLQDGEGRQRITAGGGGAYLSGTHHLPRRVELLEAGEPVEYGEPGVAFPSRERSRRLALGALRFPFFRGNRAFCVLLGLAYALLAWSAAGGVGIWSVTVTGVLVLLFGGFARVGNLEAPGWATWAWGGLHGALHIVFALSVAGWLHVRLAGRLDPGSWAHALAVHGSLALVGALAGGLLMGLYLVLSDRGPGWHDNEVFSCQASPDYKSFVRMHIDKEGGLTVYPIGVRRVPRRWSRSRDPAPGEPLIEPTHEEGPPRPHLIEGPIRL